MGALWRLERALIQGDAESAEKALVEYFRKKATEVEAYLADSFPKRARILHSAFKAHYRGNYDLSVPVFLIQADGICYDVAGAQLFRKRHKVPVITEYVRRLDANPLCIAFLHPLCISLPLTASEYERGPGFDQLNRHQVLHGECTDYGTEVNSLRAISLLNYVAQMLRDTAHNRRNGTASREQCEVQ